MDSYDVQCVKCFSPLKGGERYCAVCGWDQEPWLPEPEPPKPGEVDLDVNLDASDTLPPAEEVEAPKNDPATSAGGLALLDAAVLPGAGMPQWQKEANDAAGPSRWTRRVPALLVSLAVAFGVVALALVVDHFYFDKQNEFGRLREFKAGMVQVRAALKRGDLPAAERLLDALDAEHADDVGVQKLREELDQREEALAASATSGVVAPAPPQATPASRPAEAPPARMQEPPAVPAPAPAPAAAAGAAEPPCSEALSALSLCPKAAPAQPPREATPPP
ncbi:hypothetical protein QTH87_19340 [Variovorax sp. J22P168]|uniref:hypothetical protein n=1 Tax=Variovorax jilinensis TaxID=3053513 RepID=UPI00257581C8|nr:hypothetical protein [Variovorax sp. J22P168]MDM0014606.1 hypothetical protein [Variovorax sp. J22P168]